MESKINNVQMVKINEDKFK